ncbi:MAG: prepilin-type N-terminal cleavage/methylation domain-containing protein [Oscillospiraceae bacterium]|nr:prepilin-type N-terminal cleavage/methylation domain-containing protein [Oscillospiraceae bacterium]
MKLFKTLKQNIKSGEMPHKRARISQGEEKAETRARSRGILKNSAGFTMVELMVTLAILVIAMGMAASLILSGGSFLSRDSSMDTAKYVGDAVYSWVENRLVNAAHLSLVEPSETGAAGSGLIKVEGGRLMYRAPGESEFADVYGESFYLGNSVELSVSRAGSDVLSIRVRVLNSEGAAAYSKSSALRLANLTLEANNEIIENVSGDAALLFDYNLLAGGGYSDAAVNELSVRASALADTVNRLIKNGKYEQLKALYNLNNNILSPDELKEILLSDIGESWPETSSISNKKVLTYFYFDDESNQISTIVYYIGNNENIDLSKATHVYSTREDAWYKYNRGNLDLSADDSMSKVTNLIEGEDWTRAN